MSSIALKIMTTTMATSVRKIVRGLGFHSRHLTTTAHLQKTTPTHFKGKKSSHEWLTRQLNDPYVRRAREENWRCRSAFKLIEIDDRFNILKPGGIVIDCGAAPGSWSQVAAQRIQSQQTYTGRHEEGMVIAVDLQDIEPIEGVTILAGSDFTKLDTQTRLLHVLNNRLANTVLSDMAPRSSGNRELDHDVIFALCLSVLKFSTQVLESGGHVVCKLWDGREKQNIVSVMKKMFRTVKIMKPDASRSDSAEIFLLGLDYILRRK